MKRVKKRWLFLGAILLLTVAPLCAGGAPLTAPTAGKPNHGVDFVALLDPDSRIYYGVYDHLRNFTRPGQGGSSAPAYDGTPRPILWHVMGQEGTDGKITLMSEYVLDSQIGRAHV